MALYLELGTRSSRSLGAENNRGGGGLSINDAIHLEGGSHWIQGDGNGTKQKRGERYEKLRGKGIS